MYDKFRELLKKSGLNESEAKMFQTLSRVSGSVSLKDVIAECKMTEFTGYRTARRLAEKGFVELTKMGAIKSIRALSLEHIARSVGIEQRKLRRLELELQDLVKAVDHEESKDQVKVWEGKEHFFNLYDSLPERCKGEMLGFGSLGSLYRVTEQDYHSRYEKEWVRRRMRHGVKALLIDGEDSIYHQLSKTAPREMRDIRFIPTKGETNHWAAILDNAAFIFETRSYIPRVIEVHDGSLFGILKVHHRFLWNQARSEG